jgi:hypothetical protein
MPYVGKKPADIIATAVDTTTGTFSGVVDADAGITVDNITIDGTEIDLSSGDLTLDVAGDIILDADGADVSFRDGGTGHLSISNSSNDAVITSLQSDKDMIFKGVDGGSLVTALTLDMSAGGNATFNGSIFSGGNVVVPNGNGIDFSATSDGTTMSSELLDDYEEGTYEPAFTGSTGGTFTANTSYKTLSYTKIGRKVYIQGRIRLASSSSPSGAFYMSLPFNVATLTEESDYSVGSVAVRQVNLTGTSIHVSIGDHTTKVGFIETVDNDTWGNTQTSQVASNAMFMFGFSYLTS